MKHTSMFLIVTFLLWFPMFLISPVLATYMSGLSISYDIIGVILASYGLIQLLTRVPFSFIADHYGVRKGLIIVGFFCSVVSCALFISTTSVVGLFFARLLAGIAAASWVVYPSMYEKLVGAQQVHQAMGYLTASLVIAQTIGLVNSYMSMVWLQESQLFILAFICSVLGCIFVLRLPKVKEEVVDYIPISTFVTNRAFWLVCILSIIAHIIMFAVPFGFLPDLLINLGYAPTTIALFLACFMVPHMVAAFQFHRILNKMTISRLHLLMWLGICVAMLIMTVTINSILLTVITLMIAGYTLGILFPLFLSLVQRVSQQVQGILPMGIYQTVYAVGILIGPLIAGWIIEESTFTLLLFIMACIAFIGFCCTLLWKPLLQSLE